MARKPRLTYEWVILCLDAGSNKWWAPYGTINPNTRDGRKWLNVVADKLRDGSDVDAYMIVPTHGPQLNNIMKKLRYAGQYRRDK